MNLFKKLLAVGGVTALIVGGVLLDGNNDEVTLSHTSLTQTREIVVNEEKLAKPGDEIISLRTRESKTVKLDNGKFERRIYTAPQHYFDNETGTYKEYDTGVKEVSATAKLNPLRTHDKYVDPGEDAPKTTWFKDKPYNYTFKDSSGSYYVTYEALYNAELVMHDMQYNKYGTKEFITINDKADANNLHNELSWKLTSNAVMKLEANNDISFADDTGNLLFVSTAPWMKDADFNYYNINVTLVEDILTYSLDIPESAIYPIIIDPSTTVQAVLDGSMRNRSGQYTGGANTGARDSTASIEVLTGNMEVGQGKIGAIYYVQRGQVLFPLPSTLNISTVTALSLYLYLDNDNSTVDFNMTAVKATVGGAVTTAKFNDFYGWASTGIYEPDTLLVYPYVSSNGLSENAFNAFPFGIAGIEHVNRIVNIEDTLRIILISEEDINSSAPTDQEYLDFDIHTDVGNEPYLGIQYESIIPTGFTMTPQNADTIICIWNDIYTGEDGYAIVDATTKNPIADTTAANATADTITGLVPNTLYQWRVKIIDSESDSTSAVDSTYTHPNIPHTLKTFSPNADSMQLIFNVASNPAYTNFAIRAIRNATPVVGDTFYVDFTNKNLMQLKYPSTMTIPDADSSYIWGTYADIQAINNNDTLTVAGTTGKQYSWKVWALSGSVDKR